MKQVKRAVIMAAGIGKRMRPVTLFKPKPLVEVKGISMIASIIKALHVNGIYEIYVVVGYLRDQFNVLEKEYPGLKLIENKEYEKYNNISSLYFARDYLEDSIILDGDLIISNTSVLDPKFERSGYNAVWTNQKTNEWLMQVNKGLVYECSRDGGNKGWQLYSISRWSAEDGKKLKKHVEIEFEQNKNRHAFWDDIPLFFYPHEYQLGIHEMKKTDVIEIDSLTDLAQIDSNYKVYLNKGIKT